MGSVVVLAAIGAGAVLADAMGCALAPAHETNKKYAHTSVTTAEEAMMAY
jgi:hypothetical protein